MSAENWTESPGSPYPPQDISLAAPTYNILILLPPLQLNTQNLPCAQTSMVCFLHLRLMGGDYRDIVRLIFRIFSSSLYWLVFVIFMSTLKMTDTFFCIIFMYLWLEMNLVHFSILYLSLFKAFYLLCQQISSNYQSTSFNKVQVSSHFIEHFQLQIRISLWCFEWELSPRAHVFECLILCWWTFLGKIRRCDCVAVGMLLGVSFVVSKGHTIPSELSLPSTCE